MFNHTTQPATAKRYGVFVTVGGYMLLTLVATHAQASDLDIYQKPANGQKTLIMMLDTSGSMGADGSKGGGDSIWNDYAVNCTPSTATSTTTPTYSRKYCSVATNSSLYSGLVGKCEGASGSALKCYDRITRLKDGMFAVLDNSSDTTLNAIFMGVGNFSSNGDGSSGQILVPAAALGAPGSTQRVNLKTAIAGLTASNGTPSAHAYAEAAAYLMGTKTSGFGTPYTIQKQMWYKAVPGSSMTNRNTYYGQCVAWAATDLSNSRQLCNYTLPSNTTSPVNNGIWNNIGTTDPGVSTATSSSTVNRNSNSNYTYTIYSTSYTIPKASDGNSGFTYSVLNNQTYPGIINSAQTAYQSPLPSNTSLACGQGVYFLSDGQPNSSSDSEARSVMSNALNTTSANFVCPATTGSATSLPNTSSDSMWNCMGKFAQTLDAGGTNNPAGVVIQTAFVGFGNDFGNLASATSPSDVINACRLGSRLKAGNGYPSDSCSADLPVSNTLKNPAIGYGNGVFVRALLPTDVTSSVLSFINNLGNNGIDPLVTGSPTIPVDMLSPGALQPYGYLRQITPNPAARTTLMWNGNVKKYNVTNATVGSGSTTTVIGGVLKDRSNQFVFDTNGKLVAGTTDLWNPSTIDGGNIFQGGAYSRVPQPTSTTTATSNQLRPLFTDIGAVSTSNVITPVANGTLLTPVPGGTIDSTHSASSVVLSQLGSNTNTGGVAPFTNLTLTQKLALVNFLGYNIPIGISPTTILSSQLVAPASAFTPMGGSIHSQPVQLTYDATYAADGTIASRTEKVMYGSMEGALHVVDATTGIEQMVFVPSEIIKATTPVDPSDTTTSTRGLRGNGELSVTTLPAPDESGYSATAVPIAPTQGVDGPWVADATYKTSRGTTVAGSKLISKTMNVYGGLRMSGSVWYGLDLQTITAPKLKFRIDPSVTGFSAMGQTWSKPAMASVRTSAGIQRVMIVGGGYDTQYENPLFNNSGTIKGNTVYMINADTGALIWSASNTNMNYPIVSRIATLDRDGDGLIDSIYYGDLGGQIWRSDFNNTYGSSPFAIRTVRLADLGASTRGSGTQPRFYETPTLTVHTQGANTFVLVAAASGNRSSPIDVMPTAEGGQGNITATNGNITVPVNNVYGILDRDVASTSFLTLTPAATITPSTLIQNPQATISGVVSLAFYPTSGTGSDGWYRSLSSDSSGTEKAVGTFRKPGGLKVVEDMYAVLNKLYMGVYDPQGTGVPQRDPCQPRVVGETDLQTYCLPYGVCLDSTTGLKDPTAEGYTGFKLKSDATNDNLLHIGISSITIASLVTTGASGSTCAGLAVVGNQAPIATASCKSQLIQSQWYERKPNPAKVK